MVSGLLKIDREFNNFLEMYDYKNWNIKFLNNYYLNYLLFLKYFIFLAFFRWIWEVFGRFRWFLAAFGSPNPQKAWQMGSGRPLEAPWGARAINGGRGSG